MRLLFVTLLLALSGPVGQAQEVSIDRVDIVESGLYSVQRTGEVIQNENTAMGDILDRQPSLSNYLADFEPLAVGSRSFVP
jgi:hypothetical protein